jgi:hypothetical protein
MSSIELFKRVSVGTYHEAPDERRGREFFRTVLRGAYAGR